MILYGLIPNSKFIRVLFPAKKFFCDGNSVTHADMLVDVKDNGEEVILVLSRGLNHNQHKRLDSYI